MSRGSKNKAKDVAMAELVTSMKQQLDYYWSLGEDTDKGMNYIPICKVQQHIRERLEISHVKQGTVTLRMYI